VQDTSQAIRLAGVADADAIAQVHITAWRETYPGMVPASILASVSLVRHAELWRSRLLAPTSRTSTFVATDAVGMVIGFGSCGPPQAARLRYDGEIYAIYILRRAQHQGFGRRLMAVMARWLRERGASSALVWSARDNAPARQFYQGLGGTLVGETVDTFRGHPIVEVAYAWPVIDGLAQIDAT
jgi:GNAT superfamily N-acetyltransferase